MYLSLSLYIYIYIHTYIHTYTHIYTHIHMHLTSNPLRQYFKTTFDDYSIRLFSHAFQHILQLIHKLNNTSYPWLVLSEFKQNNFKHYTLLFIRVRLA